MKTLFASIGFLIVILATILVARIGFNMLNEVVGDYNAGKDMAALWPEALKGGAIILFGAGLTILVYILSQKFNRAYIPTYGNTEDFSDVVLRDSDSGQDSGHDSGHF